MEASSQQTTPPVETGMWAPYEPPEIGEKLDILSQVDQFVLVKVTVRPPVEVEFEGSKKMREPVDLVVQTTEPDVTRTFSGFAAGVVGQCKRIAAGDLPAVCRIATTPTGRGDTRSLELIQRPPAGADLAAIAKAAAVPMAPLNGQRSDIPY